MGLRDPFVGRDAELDALESALAQAWSGRGRLFLVAGEPGIGKSRLAAELTSRARASGAQVGWGRCWEAGGAPAYWPWAEVLTTLVDPVIERLGIHAVRERLGTAADYLGQIVPVLAGDAEPDARLAADTARFRLFDSVVRLCRYATATAPVVAVLDDVHVADQSSLLLLQYLAGHLDEIGLVVVATYREPEGGDQFSEVVAELLRERNTTRLRLHGLDADGVAELIGAIGRATGFGPPPRLVDRVCDLTDGNPLYVSEAVRLLATERGLDGSLDADRVGIPRDVRETVLRRLSHLSEACHTVLVFASVLGRDFPLDVLTVLAGDGVDVIDALDEAASAAVIVDSPGTPGHLRFAHGVMSEALYFEIPSLRRRRLHDDAGRALEAIAGEALEPRLAELARHCCASLPVGPVDRAVTSARLAGERAVRQLAYEEGARLLSMAVHALSGAEVTTSVRERTELVLELGDAQAKAGDTAAAKATFLEAADLARGSGDAEQLALAAMGYGGRFAWLRAGTDTKVISLLCEALEALSTEDSELRVWLLAWLAGARRDEPSKEARDQLSAEAVDIAARIGDAASAYALAARAAAIWGPESVAEVADLAARAVYHAQATGNLEQEAVARRIVFDAILTTGPGDHVRPALNEYIRTSEELRQPVHSWYVGVLRTVILLLEGDLAAAESDIEHTYAAGLRAQSWDAGAAHLLALSVVRWEQGRLGELEEQLVAARSVYPGYRFFRCLLALACLETGRPEEAWPIAEEMVHGGEDVLSLDNGWLFGMTVVAEVVARIGDADLAATLYDALLPFAPLVGTGGSEIASGSVHRPLGQLASVLGRHDDALRHLEAAREVHRQYGADIWLTHTDVDQAVALIRRGANEDRRHATKLLESAGEICRRNEWVALRMRVAEVSATADGAGRAATLPGGLTRREVEVARLVAQGQSNREIATSLFLSERTVESHVQHVLTKLSFTSRAEIAAWVVRTDLDQAT